MALVDWFVSPSSTYDIRFYGMCPHAQARSVFNYFEEWSNQSEGGSSLSSNVALGKTRLASRFPRLQEMFEWVVTHMHSLRMFMPATTLVCAA